MHEKFIISITKFYFLYEMLVFKIFCYYCYFTYFYITTDCKLQEFQNIELKVES